jgi:hypothetical protein
MKASDNFKSTIEEYLINRVVTDSLFRESFKKEGKNIDDCITYILNKVQKSGCNGFTDDEVFSMAVHYYDEDKIDIGKPITNARVVVNHTVETPKVERSEPAPAKPKEKVKAKPKATMTVVKKESEPINDPLPAPIPAKEEWKEQTLF